MIKEKKEFIYKPFGSFWVSMFWKEVNKWFEDGWKVCENTGNKLKDVPIILPNMIRVVFERDSIDLSLEHLKTLTKVDEYKEFCKKCDIDYDKSLEKAPMKFKKFIREWLENYEDKEEDVKLDIFLNKDSFKQVND